MSSDLLEIDQRAEVIVCPACGLQIGANEVFCPKCGAPVSLLSHVDPIQSIRAEGMMYAKAVDAKPRFVILFGIWVIFLPVFLVSLMASGSVILGGLGSGMSGFIFFWGGIAISIFSFVMLFKVTRNYFRAGESGDKLDL